MNETMSYLKEEIYAKVTKILIDYDVPQEAIFPKTNFTKDLGLDTLDRAFIAQQIEMKFGIYIPSCDMHQIISIDQVATYIQTKTN